MQSIQSKLKNKKFLKRESLYRDISGSRNLEGFEIDTQDISFRRKSNIQSWQEYAIQICKDFSLQGNYRAMIFRYAKQNMCYLQGRVENVKEKFGEGKLKELGHYLISSFRRR